MSSLDPVDSPPASLRRLFPRAYTTDDEAERLFETASRAELLSRHREALRTLAETADLRTLTHEQMEAWMAALTELRLVFGTVLDVTDEELPAAVDAESPQGVVYQYLTMLQAELIDVMEQWLPEPVEGADDAVPEDPWGEPLGDLRWDGTTQPRWPPSPFS
jgi:hypothetical protein